MRVREELLHLLRGWRLVAFDGTLQLLTLAYLGIVIADVIEAVRSDGSAPNAAWQYHVLRLDVGFLSAGALGLIIGLVMEGPTLYEHSAVAISLGHRLIFVAINLSIAIALLMMAEPPVALVRISRYLKLVGSYTSFLGVSFNLRVHWDRLKSMLRLQADLVPLRWGDDLQRIRLPPPFNSSGQHVFISHGWKYAQDTAGTVGARLPSLEVGCRSFLDVNDLDDVAHLEAHVERSDVLLIMLTESYISSANCRLAWP